MSGSSVHLFFSLTSVPRCRYHLERCGTFPTPKGASTMRQLGVLAIVTMSLFVFHAGVGADSPESKPPADIHAANKKLGRGINLGNALEAPREGEWGVILKAGYFKAIKEA